MRKLNWYEILAVILTLVFIYFLLTRLFGHSASDLTLLVSAFGTIGSWIYSLERRFSKLDRELGEIKISFGEFKSQTIERLDKLLKKR